MQSQSCGSVIFSVLFEDPVGRFFSISVVFTVIWAKCKSYMWCAQGVGVVVRIAATTTESVYKFLQHQLAGMEPLLGVSPYHWTSMENALSHERNQYWGLGCGFIVSMNEVVL